MRGTAAEPRILKALAGLGTEDGVRPKSIRTPELCRLTGITANNMGRAIQPLIDQGKVIMCKITRPGPGGPIKEFRLGSGMVQAGMVPLNPKRAGIAHGAPTKPLPVTTPAPKVSTPPPDVNDIEVPVLRKAKPEDDVGMLHRIQLMTEAEFADYINSLARLWSWHRARTLVTTAMEAE